MTTERLASVDAMRQYQRQWLQSTRASAERGEPFVLCNSDEAEDLLNCLEIPALVINYWNFVILKAGIGGQLADKLESLDYPGPHFFSLGYATSLVPNIAPWGGLPKPLLQIGSSRHDYEKRVGELWARELDCPLFPLDFNFGSPRARPLPDDWWRNIRTGWRDLTDPDRVAGRCEQVQAFLRYLDSDLGTALTTEGVAKGMQLINDQMDMWMETSAIIADAPVHPISFRDTLAMYQAMWHRGRPEGLSFVRDFRDDIVQRVERRVPGYERLELRALFWSVNAEPHYHATLQEQYGTAIVASPYNSMPAMYARDFDPRDPLPALCSRHTLLFQLTPDWMIAEAKRYRCDLIVSTEATGDFESVNAKAARDNGIPFIAIPQGTSKTRADSLLAEFFTREFRAGAD